MSHTLDWNAAFELPLKRLREKTPPTFVGTIRKHEHRPPRFRVRQSRSARDEVLRVTSQTPINSEVHSPAEIARLDATGLVRRLAPVICSSRNTRRGLTTSVIRGKDVRSQFIACKNCIMIAKPVNRSGSCLTCPCEYFPRPSLEKSALVSRSVQADLFEALQNQVQYIEQDSLVQPPTHIYRHA